MDIPSRFGKITKDVVKAGHGVERPQVASRCQVSVLGWTLPSDKFLQELESYSSRPLTSTETVWKVMLGTWKHEVDVLTEEALMSMQVDETSTFHCHFQTMEDPTVHMEFSVTLHLLSFTPGPLICDLPFETAYSEALKFKDSGNKFFTESQVVKAFHCYSRALKLLVPHGKEEPGVRDLKLKLYGNLALCQLQKKNWEHVLHLCNKAITLDPNEPKHHYRKGVAYMEKKDWENASACFQKTLELDSSNSTAKRNLELVQRELKKQENQLACNLQKLFC